MSELRRQFQRAVFELAKRVAASSYRADPWLLLCIRDVAGAAGLEREETICTILLLDAATHPELLN